MKYLATPSSIFSFSFFLIHRRALCSQPDTRFVELGEYSQNMLSEAVWTPNIASTNTPNYIREAKVRPIKNQLYSPNIPNYVCEQMFTQLRTGFTTALSHTRAAVVKRQAFSERCQWILTSNLMAVAIAPIVMHMGMFVRNDFLV